MNQPFASIIIPVYNVGVYLIDTLESVIKQTCQDFELIVIDDGSTDDSLKLAKSILEKSTIDYKIFSHSNQGVGYTRNFGIRQAVGKYVYFLDGDDTIEQNMMESLKQLTEKDFDIILFRYRHKNNISVLDNEKIGVTLSGKEIIKLFCTGKLNIHMCSFLVKRSIINDNRLSFHEKAKYGEDHEFIIKCLFHSNRGIMLDAILFEYIYRESSAVNTYSHHRLDSLESANRLLVYIKEKDSENMLSSYMSLYLLEKLRYNLYCAVQYNVTKDMKDKLLEQIRVFSQGLMKWNFIEELSLRGNLKNFINIILMRDIARQYYDYLAIKQRIKSYL